MKIPKGEIARLIIEILGATAMLMITVAVPNIASAFRDINRVYSKKQINRSLRGLKENNYLKINKKDDKISVSLTRSGIFALQEIKLNNMKINQPKLWDNKFRLVIFDIPERLKKIRKMLIERLRQLGFVMIQKSVWVHVYPCDKEIGILKNHYQIQEYLQLIIAESIPNQNRIISKILGT